MQVSKEQKNTLSIIAKKKSFGKWMKGKIVSETTRNKISEKLTGRPVSEATRLKLSKKNSGINNGMFNKHHSIEIREQISLASAKSLITRPMHSRYKHGQFYSEKNKIYLHYRSSYELLAYQLFESISKIISYEVEPIRIEYFDKIRRHYVHDVLVTYDDGQKEL